MSTTPTIRSRRPRRPAQLAPRLAEWIMVAVSVYWTLLAARWAAWVLEQVVGDASGVLGTIHRWLAWPFIVLPGMDRWPLLVDLCAVVTSGTLALGLLGILAGWWREAARRRA
ncbi:MAG: hypothetical protein NZL87_02780 [Thermomicrobium sp.]|nr:hypothetical protein [Thermomicrobium sp.]MCS7246214.1 hypothetical protein [Thermomicrobium sp.]